MSDGEHRHFDSLDAGTEWGTPEWIWRPLRDSLVNGFHLDPASGAEPKQIARNKYTIEDDGLAQDWFGHVWLNPPYGREHNPLWADKTLDEWQSGNVRSITALVPASTETAWFQDNYAKADILTFLSERVNFIGAGEDGASFPSVIATFGVANVTRDYVGTLRELGEPYPKADEIITRLIDSGCTPAQAIDYYFTEVAEYNRTEWANKRDVDINSVSRNVNNLQNCRILQEADDGI